MLVIGLGHRARQGKNFVANFMRAQQPDMRLYAFADELKLYCKEHHDELLPRWQLASQTKQVPACKEDPIYGYTKILQWYGTDVARKQDPDTWVKALAARLEVDEPEVAIITDVRFPNEAQFIKEKGGYMVNVRRLLADGSQFVDTSRDPNHPSEIALDDYEYDFIIEVKDGDLKGLKQKSIGVWNLVHLLESYPEDFSARHFALDVVRDDDATGFKA